jgi:YegS/Rv2252/BmrU family lipid kinase
MTRAVVAINPLSGRGRHHSQIQAHAALAREVLASRGVEADVRATTAPGDAHRFAREAVQDGDDLVIAWGGDGTVNEVASALVDTAVPLAIVPAGSGNGLASDLGIPFDPRRALDVAVRGRTRPIDAGRVDDSWFFNIAGIGFDAHVAAAFATRGRRQRGPLGYLTLGVRALRHVTASAYRLTIDDETVDCKAFLIAIANGRQYGNRALIAPRARLDDGLFDVVVVGDVSIARVLRELPSLFSGTLAPGADVAMHTAQRVRIEAPGAIPFHVDGEPRHGSDAITVRMHPGTLLVRTPAAAA